MLKKTIVVLMSISLIEPVLGDIGSVNTGTSNQNVLQGVSSQGTSQNTSQGTNASTANVNLTTTVVVVGGIILAVGIPLSLVTTSVKNQKTAEMRVIEYMQNNHNELTHDVSAGSGALINQMGYEMGLDQNELKKIEVRLNGSPEQRQILQTLNGDINVDDARMFSQNFSKIFIDALGRVRIDTIIQNLFHSSP